MNEEPRYYGEVDYILNMSSVTYEDFDMASQQELAALVADMLRRITSHINARLVQGEMAEDDPRYPAVCEITERKVITLLGKVQQMLVNDIISSDDLDAQLVEYSAILDGLGEELSNMHDKKVKISATRRDDIGG